MLHDFLHLLWKPNIMSVLNLVQKGSSDASDTCLVLEKISSIQLIQCKLR